MNSYIKDGKFVKSVLDEFASYTGLSFNWFDNSKPTSIDGATLAKALAFLSVKYGVDTFVTPIVDVNPKKSVFKGFALYYDQSTFVYANSYYLPGAWNLTYPKYQSNANKLLQNYGTSIGAHFDSTKIQQSVDAILEFENIIANQYTANDTIRRNYTSSWNVKNITDIQKQSVLLDWATYTLELQKLSTVNFIPNNETSNYYVSLMEDTLTLALDKYLKTVDPDVIVKYLFFRLLSSQSSFIYDPSQNARTSFERLYPQEGFSHRIGRPLPIPDPFDPHAIQVDATERTCAYQSMVYLQYANSRVLTEALYPTADAKEAIRK